MPHPFVSRLRQERRVIHWLNSRIPQSWPSLGGLSQLAVDAWAGEVAALEIDPRLGLAPLIDDLRGLSRLLRLASNTSHRGAAAEQPTADASVARELHRLEAVHGHLWHHRPAPVPLTRSDPKVPTS